MLCAVIPKMCARYSIIGKLIAYRLPCFAPIIRALDHLSEPVGRLRGIDSIWVSRRSIHMVDFPAREMRPPDIPLLALFISCQNECTLMGTNQYSYSVHMLFLSNVKDYLNH